MPQPIQLHKRETVMRYIFVLALHNENDFMHVQIYDYILEDALHTFMFDCTMTEAQVIKCLDEITSIITEKVLENLFIRYALKRYALYKELGEVGDLKEFMTVFKKEIEERIESKNEKN